MTGLFLDDDDESENESFLAENVPKIKKQRLDEESSTVADSDLDSLSDSDFEEVYLQPPEATQQFDQVTNQVTNQVTDQVTDLHGSTEGDKHTYTSTQNEFNIALNPINDEEEKKRKEKIKQLVREKRQRISLQNLSVISYMLNARHRNKILSHPKVLKCLKKLLPELFLKHYKKFKKQSEKKHSQNSFQNGDQLLIYLLKYLIKWFRKNFKHDSNGLRVLGYLPKSSNSVDYANFFPNNAKPISDVTDMCRIIRKFQHNRDTGAQLFTALLRSLGFEARLVYSLPLLDTSKPFIKWQPKVKQDIIKVNKDNDLLYPYFWTEMINPLNNSEVLVMETQCFMQEERQLIRLQRFKGTDNLQNNYTNIYYPIQSELSQMSMHYVLAFSNKNQIMDVSSRYMANISYRWFSKLDLRTESGKLALLMQSTIRILNGNTFYSKLDYLELDELRRLALTNFKVPETFSAMKKSPNFTTESTLRYNEVIVPGSKKVSTVRLDGKKKAVYFRNDVIIGKSIRQWEFLGRSVKLDEVSLPIKSVLATPKTLYNRRIYHQNMMENQQLNFTNLYSFNQTCPYIKQKISPDGKLPTNKYGNIEIYRPNMIPEGCTWLKLSDIEKHISQKCQSSTKFQYVPVVVGFAFKSGQAYPVKNGLLVLDKDAIAIKKHWLSAKIKEHKDQQHVKKMACFKAWKLFLRRLRVREHLNKKHGYL